MENQISSHQFLDSLDQILNPNRSYVYMDAKPTPHDLPAAPEKHRETWVFCQKIGNWKLGCRSIQAKRLVPSPSWGFKEGFQIKTIHPNTKKRENDGVLYRKFFTFLHLDSCIFSNFWCLIYVPWLILKLTT